MGAPDVVDATDFVESDPEIIGGVKRGTLCERVQVSGTSSGSDSGYGPALLRVFPPVSALRASSVLSRVRSGGIVFLAALSAAISSRAGL